MLPGGACFQGRVLPGGCMLPGEVVVSQHALSQIPPLVNRITDTSKNITLATTSLRPVIIGNQQISPYDCHRCQCRLFWGYGQ